MAEKELTRFAYRESYELIARDPSRLMDSLVNASRMAVRDFPRLRGWWVFLSRDESHPEASRAGPRGRRVRIPPARAPPAGDHDALCVARRVSASVPFLWIDGEARVYAATFPIPAVLLSVGICAWKRTVGLPPAGEMPQERSRRVSPLIFASAGLVAVAVAGPPFAFRAGKVVQAFPMHDPGAREEVVIRSDAPHIVVPTRGSGRNDLRPARARIRFRPALAGTGTGGFPASPAPGSRILRARLDRTCNRDPP